MSQIHFNSFELKNIDSKANSIITLHKNVLNKLSNDIKLLEEKLKYFNLPFTFIYVLSSDEKRIIFNKYKNITNRVYEEACLVWGENNKQNRLFYNIYLIKEKMNQHGQPRPINFNNIILKQSKPLIEMKLHYRLNCENELPDFYEKIIDALNLYYSKPKDYIVNESAKKFLGSKLYFLYY